jgi:hypothetical protein
MKHLAHALLLPLIALCACNGGTGSTEQTPTDTLAAELAPGIRQVRGKAGDGTSMNMAEIIDETGDTIYIAMPAQMIAGGIKAGDNIDITYNDNGEEKTSIAAVNISTLTRMWEHTDELGHKQSIELCPNGTVNTWNMGQANYKAWKTEGGKLLLQAPAIITKEVGEHTDTFQILSLTRSTLVISLHDKDITYTAR